MTQPSNPEELKQYDDIRIGGLATSCGNAPVDTALFSEIMDSKVWVGGSVAEWNRPMTPFFRHILNLYPWMTYDVPTGVNYKELRMLDSHHIDTGFLEEAGEFLDNAVYKPGPVLIHCQAGINRSNFVLAYWLVTRNGWTPDEAIDRIRERRGPTSLCNPSFESYIRGLQHAV
jgi:protein-tyrosine phosphatase